MGTPSTLDMKPSTFDKKTDSDIYMYVQGLTLISPFHFKHVQVPMKEPSMEGISVTAPIMIDCSPAKHVATDKASKIVSGVFSAEPTKAKYPGYTGYGSAIAKMRAGSGKSAMTKKQLDHKITNLDFPQKEHYESSDPLLHSTGESSKDSEEETQYYNDDPRLPLFSTKRQRFEAEEVLNILTKKPGQRDLMPASTLESSANVAFLTDARFVPLDDLSADGNETYLYIWHPTQTYRKKQMVNGRKEVQNVQKLIPIKPIKIIKNAWVHVFLIPMMSL